MFVVQILIHLVEPCYLNLSSAQLFKNQFSVKEREGATNLSKFAIGNKLEICGRMVNMQECVKNNTVTM